MLEKIFEYFDEHKEQAFILKAFLVIALVVYLKESLFFQFTFGYMFYIFGPLGYLYYLSAVSRFTGQSIGALLRKHVALIPMIGVESRTKGEKTPWVTYFLVFINVFIFYIIEMNLSLSGSEFVFKNLVFFPLEANFWNVPLSTITNMFLHSSPSHLWGNMAFLWAVGTAVESRIGSKDFAKYYFLTGLLSEILVMAGFWLFAGSTFPGLGASGAISGVMGVFAIRCYFTTMTIPIPIFALLPVSFKVKLNSLIVMGLFFLRDLGGSIDIATGQSLGGVAYFDHFVAMVLGIIFAGTSDLHKDAATEHYTHRGLESLDKRENFAEGAENLREAIEMDSENGEALLGLAQMKSQPHGTKHILTEEGAQCYEKAIKVFALKDPKRAGDVYIEYHGKYMSGLTDKALEFRVAGFLHRFGNFDCSGRAYENIIRSEGVPPNIRESALFKLAAVLEQMGLIEAADVYYRQFLQEFPMSELAGKVQFKVDNYQGERYVE